MNKIINYILVGVSSLGLGGAAGWFMAKRKYTKLYNLNVNEKRIEKEAKNYISIDKESLVEKEINKDSEVKHKTEETKPEVEQVEMDLDDEEDDIRPIGFADDIPFAVKQELMTTYNDIKSEYDDYPRLEAESIYPISAYDIGLYSEYDTISLTYLPDGTILDEDGTEIARPDVLFGPVLNKHLFDLETNGEFYIRNEIMKADYEILYKQG